MTKSVFTSNKLLARRIMGGLFSSSKPKQVVTLHGNSIFDFSVQQALSADEVSLSTFKGKKAYLVNYLELQQLYEKHSANLEILAFPCNNFGAQEPGTNQEIVDFAKKKGATFPILGKLECENGDSTHILFKYLRASLENGVLGQSLKWNFTKFLCDKNGVPVRRFGPQEAPLSFEKHIQELIDKD